MDGEIVSKDLPDSYFYVIPGEGHGATVDSPCALNIAMDFIKDPSREPNHTCLDDLSFGFFTPYDGKQPVAVVPLTEPSMRLKGVVPDGWKKQLPYTAYYRRAYLFDPTMVEFMSYAAPKNITVSYLQASFESSGFDETPTKTDSYSANGLDWTIYGSKFNGEPVVLALAEVNASRTIALAMVVSAPERDAYYHGLFLPMLDKLLPIQ